MGLLEFLSVIYVLSKVIFLTIWNHSSFSLAYLVTVLRKCITQNLEWITIIFSLFLYWEWHENYQSSQVIQFKLKNIYIVQPIPIPLCYVWKKIEVPLVVLLEITPSSAYWCFISRFKLQYFGHPKFNELFPAETRQMKLWLRIW